MAIDKIIDRAATISVSSTDVSDDANTSTGALDIPVGTTAQRPGSPTSGMIRFNTDLQTTEMYDGTAWGKVSPLTPTISSITGIIINGYAADLTLAGTNFLTSNLVVGFTPSGGSETTVTVTPTSDIAATVSVPAAIYGESVSTVIAVTVTNSDNRTSTATNMTVLAPPSGGTVLTDGAERTHIFKTTSTNFVVPTGLTLSNVEYLVVAGGGGGGGSFRAGGGGAGGLLTSVTGDTPSSNSGSVQSKLTMTAGTWVMNVGAGGTGQAYTIGTQGGNSTIVNPSSTTVVSTIGGGYGSHYGNNAGGSGGSGGGSAGAGASPYTSGLPGSGTSGQGNDGGRGLGSLNTSPQCGGGGGGAGAVGIDGGSAGTSGDGGDGVISTIISTSEATANSVGEVIGSDVWFAGGGGAGAYGSGNNAPIGGKGGGAEGYHGDAPYSNGNNASHPNTGGGGGGSSGTSSTFGTGGTGADGVIIIRYTL